MKTKLLLLLFFTSTITWAQSIPAFHGVDNSMFAVLSSTSSLDHSPAGANQTWTFNQFTHLDDVVYTYVAPTTQETTTYPGTSEVIVGTNTNGATKMYTKTATGNILSITGLTGTDLTINFSTNNATLGPFPMNYGYTNTDNVSGNYTYTTYSGTFSGTLATSIDAYGTLNLTDPIYSFSGNVIRLKTVLNISLNYIFNNVGTVTQTSYIYYLTDNSISNNPIFRSITTAAVVPIMSIDQTDTTLEEFQAVLLNTSDYALGKLWIKNPVSNTIEINTPSVIENVTVSVTDMLGKTIYQSKNNTIDGTLEIPISFSKGIYLITIGNEKETVTKKIIKR